MYEVLARGEFFKGNLVVLQLLFSDYSPKNIHKFVSNFSSIFSRDEKLSLSRIRAEADFKICNYKILGTAAFIFENKLVEGDIKWCVCGRIIAIKVKTD